MKVRRGFYPLRKLTRVRKGPHFHHRAMAADYTIGLNAAGNGKMKINFFESSDLATFAPCTLHRTLLPAQLTACTAPCFLHRYSLPRAPHPVSYTLMASPASGHSAFVGCPGCSWSDAFRRSLGSTSN